MLATAVTPGMDTRDMLAIWGMAVLIVLEHMEEPGRMDPDRPERMDPGHLDPGHPDPGRRERMGEPGRMVPEPRDRMGQGHLDPEPRDRMGQGHMDPDLRERMGEPEHVDRALRHMDPGTEERTVLVNMVRILTHTVMEPASI